MAATLSTALTRGALARAPSAAVAALQQHRRVVTVTRKHELDRPYPELDNGPIHAMDDYPDRVPIYSKLYETEAVRSLLPDSEQLIRVRLTRDVPGLGESGRSVLVHRSRYWHYLYPLGWASIASPDQQQPGSLESAESGDWRTSRVFTGPLYRLQRTLEAMELLVPINRAAYKLPDASDRLSERHLGVAFRRYGLEIPRRAIRLPDKPPPLTASGRAFKVGVQLNSQTSVSVRAVLHHVTLGETGSGLPPAKLPRVEVDDWLTEMHPKPQLPEGVRLFEPYLLSQGPPDLEKLLGSNRSRVKKS